MVKGPLVTVAAVLVTVLTVLSFAVILLPKHIATIGIIAGVVTFATVIVMIVILFCMRGTR